MDADDLEPQKPIAKPKDLEPLSIEALKDYIAELEAEIARAQKAIDAKEGHREGAESIFKR